MNVRKLCAMLNPATARLEPGSTVHDRLTAQDVAAAIGMIPDEFGRAVFCAIWWPDGAKIDRKRLLNLLHRKLWAAYLDQRKKALSLDFDLVLARAEKETYNNPPLSVRQAVERAERACEEGKRKRWPDFGPTYMKVAGAVLNELARGDTCLTCNGRGGKWIMEQFHECPNCKGRGVVRVSDAERAKTIDQSPPAYCQRWKPVYEFMWAACSDAEKRAARDMELALGHSREAA